MSTLLETVIHTLDEKLAEDIVTIDMSEVNPFTDYFVICTARNIRHSQSLAEFLEKAAYENGFEVRAREGEKDSNWILVDMYDVVVHIFTEEARKTYRLESLWADRPMQKANREE